MNIYMNGRDLIIEGATNEHILGGSFRNFAGNERKDPKTGKIVNSKGKRNFNLRIPNEFLEIFEKEGCNIKQFGGNPEEGEDPIYFVKVNINTETSARPPKVQLVKNNGELLELPTSNFNQVDGMFIDNCDMVMNFYHKYDPASIYLNLAVIKQHMDPISAKYDAAMHSAGLDPNLPDRDDEVPF
ncbi:hypothetical protein [Lachnoclostridium sp. Marseille-P6806]|uniref:hypothetical protein n=1 Tax=Lachnoclostridium sp. Marseille-P6806 TaxID=2364793 RepID=UPI00102F8B20|nr:hypothetical protein [Lachnoclostridium sp. Marseille-P6806]